MKFSIPEILITMYGIWNMVAFLYVGFDKQRAITKGWRVPEKRLIIIAFLMGAFGIWVGMRVFKHKTKHLKFKYGVPLALLTNLAVALWLDKNIV